MKTKKDHTEWNADANVREQIGYVYMESNHSHNDSISESSNIITPKGTYLPGINPPKEMLEILLIYFGNPS